MCEGILELISEIEMNCRQHEEKAIMEVLHSIGVKVDKDELLKALEYDRGQYNVGYKDGYRDALLKGSQWIPVSERPPDCDRFLGITRFNDRVCEYQKRKYPGGEDRVVGYGYHIEKDFRYWMPCPKLPEEIRRKYD